MRDSFKVLVDWLNTSPEDEHLYLCFIRSVWAAALGAELADRTYPLALEQGCLSVGTATVEWKWHLENLEDALVRLLQEKLNGSPIRKMVFKVQPKLGSPNRRIRERVVATPLPDMPVAITDAEVISDPTLREQFSRTVGRHQWAAQAAPGKE
ncbi:MAG: DUF721 domain-containing protein [Acidobacteria bacterium]|nr:DUF721 domain-containing protein [Acidobacteriota bacterium]MBI3656236.1 DUF721 domain-containing protein [Acidobacteriota bacterium]